MLETGQRIRAWHPYVDSYLDAGVSLPYAHYQVEVGEAWSEVRRTWDAMLNADTSSWDAAHRNFETAWSRFQAAWTEARRYT